ncbi:MAG TPA: hypothetical protein VN711_02365 [Candidatus Saccharimonadales bacterium]|nr:hypothetical protein [Candidatus Saccharimonadales bacterium]
MAISTAIAPPLKRGSEGLTMKIKEAQYAPLLEAGEFSEQYPTGLQIGGMAIKPRGDIGEVVAISEKSTTSNNHALFIVNSAHQSVPLAFAQTVPSNYTRSYTSRTLSSNPTLDQLTQTVTQSLGESLSRMPVPVEDVGFAHVVPTTGNTMHAVIGLSDNMIGIFTNMPGQSADGTRVITSGMLSQSEGLPGMTIGAYAIPRGTKLLLASHMHQAGALERIVALYSMSEQILLAAREDSEEAFARLPLADRALRDEVLSTLAAATYTKPYQDLLNSNNHMGLAGLLLSNMIPQSTKEPRFGNFAPFERAVVIGSYVPPIKRRQERYDS